MGFGDGRKMVTSPIRIRYVKNAYKYACDGMGWHVHLLMYLTIRQPQKKIVTILFCYPRSTHKLKELIFFEISSLYF
jgi:hypothetical protein